MMRTMKNIQVDKSSKVNFTNQVMLETKSRLKETQYNKITVKP